MSTDADGLANVRAEFSTLRETWNSLQRHRENVIYITFAAAFAVVSLQMKNEKLGPECIVQLALMLAVWGCHLFIVAQLRRVLIAVELSNRATIVISETIVPHIVKNSDDFLRAPTTLVAPPTSSCNFRITLHRVALEDLTRLNQSEGTAKVARDFSAKDWKPDPVFVLIFYASTALSVASLIICAIKLTH